MTHYTNANQPQGDLAYGDIVTFQVKNAAGHMIQVDYNVYESYMEYRSPDGGTQNALIFDLLGLEKFDAASRAYGYVTASGDWPEANWGDYGALTRCALSLYALCGTVTVKVPRVALVNDTQAKVSFKDTVRPTLINVLKGISSARGLFTPAQFREFPLEDVKATFTFLENNGLIEKDGESFKVSKKEAVDFLAAKARGEDCLVTFSLDSVFLARILKFMKDAPASVTSGQLVEKFGQGSNQELNLALNILKDKGYVKCWDRGWYTRPEHRETVTSMITKAGLV